MRKTTGQGAIFLLLAAAHSLPAMAGLQMWDFQGGSQSLSGNDSGNSLYLTSADGTGLTVTAWSDTDYSTPAVGVETAELTWANDSAVSVRNRYETTATGLTDPSDNGVTTVSRGGYDMLLLEFDTAVSLSQLELNWAAGGASGDTTDISILTWSGLGDDSPVGGSWADLLLDNGGGYDLLGNYSDVDLNYFSINPENVTSSKWLIGAYNPLFGAGGDAGDDGFALASLSTYDTTLNTPAQEVPSPATPALLLLGLALANYFGSRKGRRAAD